MCVILVSVCMFFLCWLVLVKVLRMLCRLWMEIFFEVRWCNILVIFCIGRVCSIFLMMLVSLVCVWVSSLLVFWMLMKRVVLWCRVWCICLVRVCGLG